MEESEEKRIRIELPLEVDNHEESHEKRCEKNYEDSVQFSVSLHYDILRIVFRYLNGRDLSSVAMVCRSWLEVANNEKSLRGPHCFIEQLQKDMFMDRKRWPSYKNFDHIKVKESPIKPSIGFFFSTKLRTRTMFKPALL